MKEMKILFLCRFLPHRGAMDSGRQDTYHYVQSLSERHDVSLIAFVSRHERAAVPDLKSCCRRVVVVPYAHEKLASRLLRAFWRLVMPRVYGRNISRSYRQTLASFLSVETFDLVIIDGPMAPYMRQIHSGARVLDEVDIYSEMARNHYLREEGWIRKPWAKYDWQRTLTSELAYASTADGVLVRSAKDKRFLEERLPNQDIEVLAPWFEGLEDLQVMPPERPAGNLILFVGAMDIPANQEASIFFAREVFPSVRSRIPGAEFCIVGSAPDSRVQALEQDEDVTVTGEVEELAPYYEKASINVFPLMTGGGIIVKTLNGMASGRPTVATEAGNAGTGAQNGKHLVVVSNGSQEFADAVVQVLTDDGLWSKLAIAGRTFVQQNFEWNKIIGDLEDYLGRLVKNRPEITPE
jgi:glycosyltransferase involved in cell wall biosynthesis